MREILFRGKRKDNGEWVEGFYAYCPKLSHRHFIVSFNSFGSILWFEVVPETVGQLVSGIPDKNGKKIFEGDVVQYFGTYPLEVFIENGHAKVRFYDTYSKRQYEELFFGHDEEYVKCEVIGNIHDNPELV